MIDKAVAIIEDFMKHNPEADEEQMIDIDRFHSVVFWLDSEGEFTKVDAEPPYFASSFFAALGILAMFPSSMRSSYSILRGSIIMVSCITEV